LNQQPDKNRTRVIIAGGGVAGLEALLALHDLAGDRVALTLVAPQPDFLYSPLLVDEPFDLGPADRYALEPLAREQGARFVQRAISTVRPGEHMVELDDASTMEYDLLVVCVGGRFKPAFENATTFPSGAESFSADEVLDRAVAGDQRIAFIVPGGVAWSLPLYELALMTQRRARERSLDLSLLVITPEAAPLGVFGEAASTAVAGLLRARQIELFAGSTVRELDEQGIRLSPQDRVLGPAVAVALPVMEGPALEGIPSDTHGFILVDDHGRVKGAEGVYAAGDGTNFPIKQGGLGTQQADAAAEHIAHRLGALTDPDPFRPVLRGKLLTGYESLNLRADVAGGGGEGEASPDYLWWPPHKISARYLAPFLYHGDTQNQPEPPGESLDVEVALPHEWHQQAMGIDPEFHPRID
jgi:sulfide:quinone oxidoreductase